MATMSEPNPAQIAPGEEASMSPQDTPYDGWRPSEHMGYPLNASFWEGAQYGTQ